MGKTAKKNNRKMRKTVRRTIGALCMISAITIAAIPATENRAYDPTTETIVPYSDVKAMGSTSTIEAVADTKSLTAADVKTGLIGPMKTYAVSQRNGIVSLDWQFEVKYNDAGDSTKTNGFITQYNSSYVSDNPTLTVSSYLFADYAYVDLNAVKAITEREAYDKATTVHTVNVDVNIGDATPITRTVNKIGIEYTLTGDPYTFTGDSSDPEQIKDPTNYEVTSTFAAKDEYKFFDANFNDLLLEYMDKYLKYHTKDSSQPMPPSDLKKALMDQEGYNTVELQQKYVCEKLLSADTPSGVTMSLQDVTMMTYDSAGNQGSKQIYIFKVLDGMSAISQKSFAAMPKLLFTDNDNYLTTSYINMVGIAENAMEGVANVTELILDNNIQYICDKAFNNSSLLKSVTLPANAQIGRMAFANGKDLENVSLGGLNIINTEAFFNTNIKSIEIPNSVTSIEDGAFANCSNLQSVIFTGATNNSVTIKAGAFADCPALTSVDFGQAKIEKIGDYAFALNDSALRNMDHLENFSFPLFISAGNNLGDYVLAGRSQLRNVNLPTGISGIQTIPEHMVIQCPNLSSFVFPDNCNQTSYDPTMFADVVNPQFYVKGPAKDGTKFAKPRTSTWSAKKDVTGNNTPVTYRYTDPDTGKDIFEINQDGLVLGVNDEGILVNCQFDPDNIPTSPQPVTIPAKVGEVTLTGIAEGCFASDVKEKISKITIEDGSKINSLADNSFANFDKLVEVELGDSINTIGKSAFEGCDLLEKVTIGENIHSIGDSAFANNPKLVDVFFDKPYQTDILGGNYLKSTDIGKDALTTGSPKLTVHGTIIPDYGPFAWSMDQTNFVNNATGLRVCYNSPAPDNLTVILDNTNLYPTLVDYPHYEYLPKDLRDKIESGAALDVDEQYAYNCTRDITVPAGVKSIDVKHFITATADSTSVTGLDNKKSADTYLAPLDYYDQYKQNGLFNGYYGLNMKNTDSTDDLTILGTNEAYEYKTTDGDRGAFEKDNKGNDRITSVVMEDVVYLPDKAFDNCEKLNMVALGDDIVNVGTLPFYDCTNLASVGCSNGKYIANNGILYENLASGKEKLIECFASRGGVVGASSVDTNNDPDLVNVIEIAPHAFDDCDEIRFVDFTDADDISTIPEGCFANCDNLRTVELPTTVDQIEKDAFTNNESDVEIIARNRQIFLSSGAIDKSGGNTPYFVTYKDAQSRKYAKEQGANIDKTLDEYFTVKFYSYDGRLLLGTDFVQQGKTAIPPDDSVIPDRTSEGLVFDKWSIDLRNITSDCFALAMYKPIGTVTPTPKPIISPTPGITPGVTTAPQPKPSPNVTPSPTGDAKKYTLTVVYGSGSGQYPANTKVIIEAIAAPAGKEFDKWVVTGAGATVYSTTSKATTITTAAGDSNVTATYKDIANNTNNNTNKNNNNSSGTYSRTGTGSSGVSGNGGTSTGSNTNLNITKPGFSDIDKAYASVNGSTDNFLVKVTEDANAANQIATALANKYPDMNAIKYFPMDISLYDATGTNKISNDANLSVNVTMPIPDALRQYGGNCKVASVINGNQLEDLPCKFVTVSGVPCVSFTATHFSPYTIYVDTNNLVYGLSDGSPKTGDPIHPKWFVVIALAATSLFLFLKKDNVRIPRTV